MASKLPHSATPSLFDIRVRERHLRSGALDPKALEKHLADLPDLSDRAESVTLPQPALDGDDE
jgi:hypothetical protein